MLFLTFAATTSAAAQEPRLVEVRTAFGATNYLHGDFDFVAPTLLVSARIGRAVAIEPEFGIAWHEETQTFGFGTGATITTASRRFQSAGINIVRRWAGSVSPYAGAGVGIYWEPRRFESRTGDQAVIRRSTEGPRGGAQALAGIDFRINSRIAAFGQVRFEFRSLQDPAGGAFQGLGGIAVGL